MTRALQLDSYSPVALMDWNNNYGDEDNKCILFHCGPAPASLMDGRGRITGSLMTEEGKVKVYLGEGRITRDPIPEDFFGVAGVAEIPALQDVLLHVGSNGHRHHVSIAPGWVQAPICRALGYYLDFTVELPQE